MIKKFCDRCGREIQQFDLFTLSLDIFTLSCGSSLLSKTYQVCGDCKKAFKLFMQDGKETEGLKNEAIDR